MSFSTLLTLCDPVMACDFPSRARKTYSTLTLKLKEFSFEMFPLIRHKLYSRQFISFG